MELTYYTILVVLSTLLGVAILWVLKVSVQDLIKAKKAKEMSLAEKQKEEEGLPTPPWGFEWIITKGYTPEYSLLWLVREGSQEPYDVAGRSDWTTLTLTGEPSKDNYTLKFSASYLMRKMSNIEGTKDLSASMLGRHTEGFQF